MNHTPGILAADPARVTGDGSDFAVQRSRQLKGDEREPPRDIFYKRLIEGPALLFQDSRPGLGCLARLSRPEIPYRQRADSGPSCRQRLL